MNNVIRGTLSHMVGLVCVSVAPGAFGAPVGQAPTAPAQPGPAWHGQQQQTAQWPASGPPPAAAAPHDDRVHREQGGRPARTGFQMAIRTGLAFPSGKASAAPGDTLARRYSMQWPLHFDLGAKVTEHVHVGGYFTMAFGAEGNDIDIEQYCDDDDSNLENDISCSSYGFRLGAQSQYHFLPDQGTNPWLGYGIGFESTTQHLRDAPRGYDEQTTASGITYAKLDAGLDFRLPVGLGLYTEAAFGRFNTSSTRINGEKVYDGEVDERAWHMWLTLGARLVIFP